jgi:RNA polymerase sigma factor (sigma-70 family)
MPDSWVSPFRPPDRPDRRSAIGTVSCDVARAAQRDLLRRYHVQGDLRARAQLAEQLLPLARSLAGRYINRNETYDDLVQVACIGLMKAIDRFDLSRNTSFSSYATPTILGEIKRHFRDRTWAVRPPRALQELQARVAEARDGLTHELGRGPTIGELAECLKRWTRRAPNSSAPRSGRSSFEPRAGSPIMGRVVHATCGYVYNGRYGAVERHPRRRARRKALAACRAHACSAGHRRPLTALPGPR